MRVLVCGGRDFADRALMSRVLSPYRPKIAEVSEVILIVGGAPGADTLAEEWADVFGVRKRVFPADWKSHGRAAGPIRNQRMLDEGKPDLVVAFPGGRGTADMVRRARAAGVKVWEVPARVSDEHSQSENAERSRGEALPARCHEVTDALPLSSHGEEKKGGGE